MAQNEESVSQIPSFKMRHLCSVCNKTFPAKKNLSQHQRRIHDLQVSSSIGYLCDQCDDVRLPSMHYLVQHHRTLHGFAENYETLKFASTEEFEAWKLQEEKQRMARFSARHGSQLRNGQTRKFLFCHRSGVFSSRGTKKRLLKAQGSCKMGKMCLAYMEVTHKPDGKVRVVYQKEHYGHDSEVRHLYLSKDEKEAIADRLREGIPMQAVLNGIRDTISEGTTPAHKVTIQTLHNIKHAFKINSKDTLHASREEALLTAKAMLIAKSEAILGHLKMGEHDEATYNGIDSHFDQILLELNKSTMMHTPFAEELSEKDRKWASKVCSMTKPSTADEVKVLAIIATLDHDYVTLKSWEQLEILKTVQ